MALICTQGVVSINADVERVKSTKTLICACVSLRLLRKANDFLESKKSGKWK